MESSANCKEKKAIWQYPGILQTNEVALRHLIFQHTHTHLIILLPSNQASSSCFPAWAPHQTLGALGCCEWLVTHGECYSQGVSWMGWGIRLAASQRKKKPGRHVLDVPMIARFYILNCKGMCFEGLSILLLFSKNSSLSHSATESEIETAHWKTSLEPTESRDSPEH